MQELKNKNAQSCCEANVLESEKLVDACSLPNCEEFAISRKKRDENLAKPQGKARRSDRLKTKAQRLRKARRSERLKTKAQKLSNTNDCLNKLF